MMFDFNECFNLYKNGDIEYGRIMLYANINVFLSQTGFNIEYYYYDDIVQDSILKMDEWIKTSIERGNGPKQTYAYLKLRLRGFLINKSKRPDKMTYFQSYGDIERADEISEFNDGFIKGVVYNLKEPERSVVIMRHYMDVTFEKIGDVLGISQQKAIKIYNQALLLLKDKLDGIPSTS